MKENQNLKTLIYSKHEVKGAQSRALPIKAGIEGRDRMQHIL